MLAAQAYTPVLYIFGAVVHIRSSYAGTIFPMTRVHLLMGRVPTLVAGVRPKTFEKLQHEVDLQKSIFKAQEDLKNLINQPGTDPGMIAKATEMLHSLQQEVSVSKKEVRVVYCPERVPMM